MKKHTSTKAPYSRTRNRNWLVPISGAAYMYSEANGVRTVVADYPRFYLHENKVELFDWVTPGYEKLVANGKIINNPMHSECWSYTDGIGGFTGHYTSGDTYAHWSETKTGTFYFGVPTPATHGINIANLQQYVQTKCLASAQTSSLQGLVAIGEGHKTLQMIMHPLSAFASLIQHVAQLRAGRKNIAISSRGRTLTINGRVFKNPNWRYNGPGRLVRPPATNIVIPAGKAISGAVLANNLGLRPLMMDLEAFLKDIPNAHQNARNTFRSKLSDSWSTTVITDRSIAGIAFKIRTTTEVKATVKAMCMTRDKFDILQDFGMSVYDVPSAMWEFIPYSFLVDYVVNVADLLAAQRALQTQDILCASVSTTIDTVVTESVLSAILPAPYILDTGVSGSSQLTCTAKTRTVGFDNVGFAYRPVSQVARPTVIQNTLSLIVQALTSIGGKRARTFY